MWSHLSSHTPFYIVIYTSAILQTTASRVHRRHTCRTHPTRHPRRTCSINKSPQHWPSLHPPNTRLTHRSSPLDATHPTTQLNPLPFRSPSHCQSTDFQSHTTLSHHIFLTIPVFFYDLFVYFIRKKKINPFNSQRHGKGFAFVFEWIDTSIQC